MAETTPTFTMVDLASSSYSLSSDGIVKVGTVKLGGFKSGSFTIDADTVDNSTRDDQGWTANLPGKRSATVELTYSKLETDPCQVGIRETYLLGTETGGESTFQKKAVEIEFRSTADSTTGIKGTFILTSYSESQESDSSAIECTASFSNIGAVTKTTVSSGGST